MGFLLTMAVLWLVFGHWARRSRYACGRGMRLEPGSWRGRSRHGHDVQGVGGRAPPRPVTRESRLELLKRRYVRGELSDEQYEEELDALFRASSVRGRALMPGGGVRDGAPALRIGTASRPGGLYEVPRFRFVAAPPAGFGSGIGPDPD